MCPRDPPPPHSCLSSWVWASLLLETQSIELGLCLSHNPKPFGAGGFFRLGLSLPACKMGVLAFTLPSCSGDSERLTRVPALSLPAPEPTVPCSPSLGPWRLLPLTPAHTCPPSTLCPKAHCAGLRRRSQTQSHWDQMLGSFNPETGPSHHWGDMHWSTGQIWGASGASTSGSSTERDQASHRTEMAAGFYGFADGAEVRGSSLARDPAPKDAFSHDGLSPPGGRGQFALQTAGFPHICCHRPIQHLAWRGWRL